MSFSRIVVLGLGKVGHLAAELLKVGTVMVRVRDDQYHHCSACISNLCSVYVLGYARDALG